MSEATLATAGGGVGRTPPEPAVSCGKCGIDLRFVERNRSWIHKELPPRRIAFHLATPNGRQFERWSAWKSA